MQYKERILLIEDDAPLAELISDFLSSQGFRVTLALNGTQAIHFSEDCTFDVIVCDLMLPDIHGFRLAQKLRIAQTCPLIFLTALGDDETHIQGLELGASDFIAKPVKPQVLLARIKTQLRKQALVEEVDELSFGEYRLQQRAKTLFKRDEIIPLTNQEFDILWLFASHPDDPLSREFMFKQVVGRPYDGSDRAADLKISRVRKKLQQLGCGDLNIRTIRGRGYILVLENNA
ncbi:response regulator transcription factor [Alteromonas facilis]|uniref:response regulator transcription factor n=1 Tax=Alteromonas facilis TaxID=2048004 RepID=UPI000C282094|nr:response regulator transcription factor [Alteromonas facilis]